MAVEYLGTGNDDGVVMGRDADDPIAFYNATPAAQPADSNQASVSATTTTTATTTALETDLDAVRTLVNQIRGDLVTLGLLKGEA